MDTEIKDFIRENIEYIINTVKELCEIPAPSHNEQQRAEYCKNWLEREGADGTYIDDAFNVVFPLNCNDSNKISVLAAHTDTVFPDTEPMPYIDDGSKIYCPGVGDDTASVAILLMLVKYFLEKKVTVPNGILFVFNSCEEGLGNLKGTRKIFSDYEGRIAQFITFDSQIDIIADRCAGSHRYEVEVLTEGGHSYAKFGNANAICELSKIITSIYNIDVPQKEGSYTTYNVGNISGGTSVNTIAQSAKMLCEYRSNDKICLEIMRKKFIDIFNSASSKEVQVNVRKIGDRPCSDIEDSETERLRNMVKPVIESVIKNTVKFTCSSTDCNIPLSMGIPAICIGVYYGEGAHTRQEWIDKSSLKTGMEIAIKIAHCIAETM